MTRARREITTPAPAVQPDPETIYRQNVADILGDLQPLAGLTAGRTARIIHYVMLLHRNRHRFAGRRATTADLRALLAEESNA